MRRKIIAALVLMVISFGFSRTAHSSLATATQAYQRGDYQESVHEFGNAGARGQYIVGLFYYDGKVVDKNMREAAKWFTRAAHQGHIGAAFMLGTMYENGKGVRRDRHEAIKWYRYAADQGHHKAATRLSHL